MCPRDFGDGNLGPNDTDGEPMGPGGWSASQPLTCLNTNTYASLQANFDESNVYTVQFGLFTIDPQPNIAIPRIIYCEATIEWSVAGNTVSRKVSVQNGTTISGVGQGVRVVVKDATIDGSMGGVRYGVNITVAPGQRSSLIPPFLCADGPQGVRQINNLAAITYQIPQGIGINSVQVGVADVATFAPILDQEVIVTQTDGTGATKLSQCDPRQFDWIPLMPGAVVISIYNQSGGAIYATTLWGIDG